MSQQQIQVLVVDDSAVVRGLIARALETDTEIAVVGTAMHGEAALVLQLDFLDIGTKCTFSTGIRGGQGCRLIRKLPSGLRKSMRRPG